MFFLGVVINNRHLERSFLSVGMIAYEGNREIPAIENSLR